MRRFLVSLVDLRLLAKYSYQHYLGLQMATHGQRAVLTTASRRRIRQVAIAGQVLRHFTAPWADQFLSDVESQLQQAYPGRAGLISSVCVPRFASMLGRRANEFSLNPHAHVRTPGAAPPPQMASVPELLLNSQYVYDSQLSSYNLLVEDMNNTIAMFKGKLDQLPSSSGGADGGHATGVIKERVDSADEEGQAADDLSAGADGSHRHSRSPSGCESEGAAAVSQGSGNNDDSVTDDGRGELGTMRKQVGTIQALVDSLPQRIDNRIAAHIKEEKACTEAKIHELIKSLPQFTAELIPPMVDKMASAYFDKMAEVMLREVR